MTSIGAAIFAYRCDNMGRKTEVREDSANGPLRASWSYDTVAVGLPLCSPIPKAPPTTQSVTGTAPCSTSTPLLPVGPMGMCNR
jgi:hypothetical protein